MSKTVDGAAISSLVASYEDSLSNVSVKAVGSQIVLMSVISVGSLLAFSFFRPREKKVYAPKIKYQLPKPEDPLDDTDYEPPPPTISNGFFAWFSPVIHLKEEQLIANIGLDAAAFLRFLRMLRWIFTYISGLAAVLLALNIIYNLKYVDSGARNTLSTLTLQNVRGTWMWSAVAASYIFNFIIMFFIWRNWRAMVQLRSRWFRSPSYQSKIYSRTLMVTQVKKEYRSDAGLVALMGQLKVDGIKIGPEIECTTIGRRLENFPEMVKAHNEAVAELEGYLVKYLKGDKMGSKRPTLKKGGFMGIGGERKDAIDYLSKEIKSLRDKIDARRQAIDSLIRTERRAKKAGKPAQRLEGENYGFVTFKTIAQAHRIARTHRGRIRELSGAQLHLAPMPHDIVWENISKEPAEIGSRTTFGFILIGIVCFFNTLPLLVVSILANLSVLALFVPFLDTWKGSGQWGNWTFSFVSGILPSTVSALFGYFLPMIIRKISKYQGAPTRSRLDRAVTARYYFFLVISNFVVFSLLGVVYSAIGSVVLQIGQHQSAATIFSSFSTIPNKIQGTYVQQSTYWLTWLPLRGFLVIFELIQLIKLALVSLRRFMFSHTPRDIRDMTKPPYFEYAVVVTNLLFVGTVGLIYAPLAPLVAIGACIVFWFSSVVYKYQLLYVYVSRAESGGRMWNVYVNRLIAGAVLMQLLMVLTTGLIRSRWLDCVAAAPPIVIMFAFKIFISKTAENEFRYYLPSAEEAEAERARRFNEKGTKVHDMEKRFLHPALQAHKLYTIMVHKQQEGLAREVLRAYPWFAGKHERQGVQIKAVREENLEYDPSRDGPRDEAHQAEWDAKSIASTDMLGGRGAFSTPATPSAETEMMFSRYPPPGQDTSPDTAYNSTVNLPLDNPSTDQLLYSGERAESRAPRRQPSRPYPGQYANQSDVALSPLLDRDPDAYGNRDPESIPYPPSAYNQPPIGFAPPAFRRTNTDRTDDSDLGAQTRWDDGADVGYGRQGPPDGYGYTYDDPYGPGGYDLARRESDGDARGTAPGYNSHSHSGGQQDRRGARNGDEW